MNTQAGNHSSTLLSSLRTLVSTELRKEAEAGKRFRYSAIMEGQGTVRGVLRSPSREAAQRQLLRRYTHLLDLEEIVSASWGDVLADLRETSAALPVYTRSIAVMLSAGLPIAQIFDSVAQGDDPYLNRVMKSVADNLRRGSTLTDALSRWKGVFGPVFLGMCAAAEKSGRLHVTFGRLAGLLEDEWRLKKRVRAALSYPLLISVVSIAIFWILVAVVVPNLTPAFASVGAVLPWPTRVLVWFGELSTSLPVILTAFSATGLGLAVAFRVVVRGEYFPHLHLAWDRFRLSLPLLGDLFRLSILTRTLSTMGALVEAGLPLTHVLKSAGQVSGSPVYQRHFDEVLAELRNGSTFSSSLGHTGGFPTLMVAVAQVGEESGKLPFLMSKVAEMYEQELDNKIKALTSLIEPVVMAVLGLVVGFIVLATFLPILNLVQGL